MSDAVLKDLGDAFVEEKYYHGGLFARGQLIGEARADITFNELDTNNIIVRLTDIKWFEERASQSKLGREHLHFLSDNRAVSMKLSEDSLFPFSECVTTANELHNVIEDSNLEPSESRQTVGHISYNFPLSALVAYHRGSSFHDYRGFVRGWMKEPPESFHPPEIEWYNDYVDLETVLGKATMYDSMVKREVESQDRKKYEVIARRGVLFFSEEGENLTAQDVRLKSREKARVIFLFLSLCEGNPTDWYTEHIAIDDTDRKRVTEEKTHRWAMKGRLHDLEVGRGFRYKRDLRTLLPSLINSYCRLPDSRKRVIDEVMKSYQIASIASTIEAQLVYWHSCLDRVKKEFGPSEPPFSKNLIVSCENAEIDIADLRFGMSKERNKKFRFNEIRDKYLHEGLIIDDYPEVIAETRKIKALVERLLLNLLGLNYRNTKLGIPFP